MSMFGSEEWMPRISCVISVSEPNAQPISILAVNSSTRENQETKRVKVFTPSPNIFEKLR
jgi:hypothetical protein